MNEEAKVRLADEAIAIVRQSGKKMESREDKFSVKNWELDGNVYRDSSVESDTEDPSDSLRPIGILPLQSCSATLSFVCYLPLATVAFVSFFVFAILPEQLQENYLLTSP